jgi:hypothetical protein
VFGAVVWAALMFTFWHANYPETNKEGAQGMFVCWEFLPFAFITLPFCIGLPSLVWLRWVNV